MTELPRSWVKHWTVLALHVKGKPKIVYEGIAKRILEAVINGERDPIRLRDAGLGAFGPYYDNKTG